jgi:hypothetical protein
MSNARACMWWFTVLCCVLVTQSALECLIDRTVLCRTLQDHLLSSLATIVPDELGFARTLYHCAARQQSAEAYKQWLQLPLWLPTVGTLAARGHLKAAPARLVF